MEYTEEVLHFEQKFAPEEERVIGLVEMQGWTGLQEEGEEYLTAQTYLQVWKKVGGEICQDAICIQRKADERLLRFLKRSATGGSIVCCSLRQSLTEPRVFYLEGNPRRVEDEEIQRIQEEMQKPVEYQAEGLGLFYLNPSEEWFETNMDWKGVSLEIVLDNGEKETLDWQASQAKRILENLEQWEEAARQIAVDELLEIKNAEYLETDEGEEAMDRKNFLKTIKLECLQIFQDGLVGIWFSDEDMFHGQQILVSGNVEQGLLEAELV
ncbi:MAG: DUF2262 domain-containing protein [bacterium]|nr:DUF2262 domain-containing protein [bacterium]